MPVWLVKATWIEDEIEASEQWEVNAPTELEAIASVNGHLRYQPHHLEASRVSAEAGSAAPPAGVARRVVAG
jgi:hypothetical protein